MHTTKKCARNPYTSFIKQRREQVLCLLSQYHRFLIYSDLHGYFANTERGRKPASLSSLFVFFSLSEKI